MYEKHHYKGNFEFYFLRGNQTKLAKSLLPAIFPPEAIKKVRGRKLEQYDKDLVVAKARGFLPIIQAYKPLFLKRYLHDLFTKAPEDVVLYYLVLKRVAEEVSLPDYFHIESDLAQNILIEALERQLGD